jgi:hypothetical protein
VEFLPPQDPPSAPDAVHTGAEGVDAVYTDAK